MPDSGKKTKKSPAHSKKTAAEAKKAAQKASGRTTNTSHTSGTSSKNGTNSKKSQSGGKQNTNRTGSVDSAKSSSKPMRREVWGAVCLIIAVFAFLGCFNNDGAIIKIGRNFFGGLLGWGYYITVPSLILTSAILFFHHGRPIKARVVCALLIPFCASCFYHLIKTLPLYYTSSGQISLLVRGENWAQIMWETGKEGTSGGLFGGFITVSFAYMFHKAGAAVIFIIATAAVLYVSLAPFVSKLYKIYKAKNRIEYEEEEEPDYDALYPPKKVKKHGEKVFRDEDYYTYSASAVPPIERVPIPTQTPIRVIEQESTEKVRSSNKRKLNPKDYDINLDDSYPAPAEQVPSEAVTIYEHPAPKSDIQIHTDTPAANTDVAENSADYYKNDQEPESVRLARQYTPHGAGSASSGTSRKEPAKKPDTPIQNGHFYSDSGSNVFSNADFVKDNSVELTPATQKLESDTDIDRLLTMVRDVQSGIVPESQIAVEVSENESETSGYEPQNNDNAASIDELPIGDSGMNDYLGQTEIVPETVYIPSSAFVSTSNENKSDTHATSEYRLPASALLSKNLETDNSDNISVAQETKTNLEKTLKSFGINPDINNIVIGPSVTRYDMKLETGVRLNKITGLSDDIALALGATGVRISAIPNKQSTIGIEVPNKKTSTVDLRELIESDAFTKAESKLSFAIGKNIGGEAVVGNISKLPHLLVAGTTGSGKSVFMNSLILSILYKAKPEEVKFIMVDPKMVEFAVYMGIPHLLVPVVTEAKKAAGALQWAVTEMMRRYSKFSECGVRDLPGYNKFSEMTLDIEPMPQVVIVIDELADLMMVAAKEVEESICRVAQMGRAAGIHLIIATQSPRADVITGLMKANIPSRISFKVASSLESRIILDAGGGAEKLLGNGDMLYAPIGSTKPLRLQGCWVSDEDRDHVVSFIKEQASADYSDSAIREIELAAADKDKKKDAADSNADSDSNPFSDCDELLPDAVDIIFEVNQASVSIVQRKLKVGYARAGRLIDQMEEMGIVGPHEGSKPRQILITKSEWQEMKYSSGTAPSSGSYLPPDSYTE